MRKKNRNKEWTVERKQKVKGRKSRKEKDSWRKKKTREGKGKDCKTKKITNEGTKMRVPVLGSKRGTLGGQKRTVIRRKDQGEDGKGK
jgi:hypothetical protein